MQEEGPGVVVRGGLGTIFASCQFTVSGRPARGIPGRGTDRVPGHAWLLERCCLLSVYGASCGLNGKHGLSGLRAPCCGLIDVTGSPVLALRLRNLPCTGALGLHAVCERGGGGQVGTHVVPLDFT